MLRSVHFERSPAARRNDLISEEISGEYVVYDTRRKKAHHLNPTLSWIWRRCDGTNTIEGLAAAFEREFKIDNGREIVLDGLKQIQCCHLLDLPVTVPQPETNSGAGLTRRAVVTSGAVVLPAVVSMVAPTAAAAKSKPNKDKDKKDKELKF